MNHNIVMPDLGQTTNEGKILKWLKKPGDRVSKGELLFEVETDKVTMEVEAYLSGYLREVLASEGATVSSMTPVAVFTDSAAEPYERPTQQPQFQAAEQQSSRTPATASSLPERVSAAPAARSLAHELIIDLGLITGTGPEGLITRRDVERYAAERTTAKPMVGMAALTTRSKQTIPHFYAMEDVDVTAAQRWRENWNKIHPQLTATVNDIHVRAAAKALRDVPALNVAYRDGRREQRSSADVLLVVAVEPGLGLALAPLSDPGALPWDEYLRTIRTAVEKAKRNRALEAHPQGTPLLAISNLGKFGIKQFAAIIPPFCTAILAIGVTREEAVVSDGQIRIGQVCGLTLSADHRVVDGLIAAKFLKKMQEHLNTL